MIKVKDTVLHTLSGLYYLCENTKHEKWMNQNPYYKLVQKDIVSESYFYKSKGK